MKRFILYFLLLVIINIAFSGCGTIKGAADGAKQDWKKLERWDDDFQEKYW